MSEAMNNIRSRFLEKIQKDKHGHWIWKGASDGSHGKLWIDGKPRSASRVAMKLYGKPVPKGKQAVRTCNVDLCVNPDHHIIGTRKEAGCMGVLRERRGTLDIVLAAEIRDTYAIGDTSTHSLATDYEVAQSTIMKVIHKRSFYAAEKLNAKLKSLAV